MTAKEIKQLKELREILLNGDLTRDYWSPERLRLYHVTLGERIGWKWDSVLRELEALGVQWPRHVIDWGCGSGVASVRVTRAVGGPISHQAFDRNPLCEAMTRENLRAAATNVTFETGALKWDGALVVLSHVISELTPVALQSLVKDLKRTAMVIWVEPGEKRSSERLLGVREELRGHFSVVAPCTHQKACPLAGQSSAWCHQFAEVPSIAFQDRAWSEWAKWLGIDLRSLPVSYLVLGAEGGASGARVIGRPRLRGGHALVTSCGAEGLKLDTVTKADKPVFQALKENPFRLILK
ncbi:MAG: hypothetical protein HYR96_03340 [Deltaproteobacteria bacterium]|nr:hypothetical protein [Deltaproteobacteria bacterium]MBI3294284.1 hypothetical protein [Deltaproteobacteria bacterium]